MSADPVMLHCGDCLAVLAALPADFIDSCVTDPPYHLTNNTGSRSPNPGQYTPIGKPKEPKGGFMGKQWDGGDIAFRPEVWREVYRVLKPGAHLLAFGGTRTYHRMACAIEDAGFEIRDTIMWLYGSGFPKSHNIGNGWGTALKPACEPIVLARKPLSEGTIAANVLKHGTGALNIDGCRVEHQTVNGGNLADNPHLRETIRNGATVNASNIDTKSGDLKPSPLGRWPANLIHDGSEEVVEGFPDSLARPADDAVNGKGSGSGDLIQSTCYGAGRLSAARTGYKDSETSAARFFYTAKADSDDRLGSKHPTVKPLDLIQYLIRLVTPKGGVCLDPFAGTGTLGEAAIREGMRAVLIEREAEYQDDIRRRIKLAMCGPDERVRESIKARGKTESAGPLFQLTMATS